MVTIVCIDNKGSKILELNKHYKAIEEGNCYWIPIKENNLTGFSSSFRRKYLKVYKDRFVKVGGENITKESSKRTFCDANNELRNLIQDIICEVEMAIKYNETSSLEVVIDDLRNAEEIIEENQTYVESMEDRLSKYKKTIESLGFVRRKN